MNIPDLDASPSMQRILHVLAKKPNMSVSDISAEAFVGVTTLRCGGYMRALKKRGRVYVSGWRKAGSRFSVPLYSLGGLDDVPRPKVDDGNRDAPGMQAIVETLAHFGPLSYREIARFSGLSLNTVKNSGYLAALIAQERIHVGGWQRSHGGPMSPVYHPGPGEAVARPGAISAAEKSRRHRERTRIASRGDGLRAQLAAL